MAAGLKEGSYWEKIATEYVKGPPERSMIKAIYNLWRSNYFVKLVTEMLELKVSYESHLQGSRHFFVTSMNSR